MLRSLLLALLGARAAAQKHDCSAKIDAHYRDPLDEVALRPAFFEPGFGADELLEPFVKEPRFKAPFVKVLTDGAQTWRYEQEGSPTDVEEAVDLLHEDDLNYVLRFEHLAFEEWPEVLRALLPEALEKDLTDDPYEGGATVHAYVSAPGAAALPEHHDIGDVLVLQVSGEKAWTLGDREFTMAPGDGLWLPAHTKHVARASEDTPSVHITIHRVSAEAGEKAATEQKEAEERARERKEREEERRLNHVNGDDGTEDDEIVYTDKTCVSFDAGCTGGYRGKEKDKKCRRARISTVGRGGSSLFNARRGDVVKLGPCNLCNICSDSGSFCMNSVDDVTFGRPCCAEIHEIGDISYPIGGCKADDIGEADTTHWIRLDADADKVLTDCNDEDFVRNKGWPRVSNGPPDYLSCLLNPKYTCEWVAKDPDERCNTKGVVVNDPGHYGIQWLLDNQPRYKAKDACPITCKGGGGGGNCKKEDDDKWKYKAGDKGKQKCKDVADKPDKRCCRLGTDGRYANEACPCACKKHKDKCEDETCENDPKWYDRDQGKKKDCDWVAKNRKNRCKTGNKELKGKDKNGKTKRVTDACKEACKTC